MRVINLHPPGLPQGVNSFTLYADSGKRAYASFCRPCSTYAGGDRGSMTCVPGKESVARSMPGAAAVRRRHPDQRPRAPSGGLRAHSIRAAGPPSAVQRRSNNYTVPHSGNGAVALSYNKFQGRKSMQSTATSVVGGSGHKFVIRLQPYRGGRHDAPSGRFVYMHKQRLTIYGLVVSRS